MANFFKHPQYKELEPNWTQYRDLFEGDHQKLVDSKYLWLHEFEGNKQGGAELRRIRTERTRYMNLIKPLIRRFSSMLFANGIDLEKVQADLDPAESNDIDGEGTSLENFIRRDIAEKYFLYGRPIVMAETFDLQLRNANDEREQGARPYLEVICPLEFVDWQIENQDSARRGRFNFIRTEYIAIEPRLTPSDEPEERVYSKVWIKEGSGFQSQLYRGPEKKDKDKKDQAWDLVDEKFIPIPEIPVARIFDNGWIADIAPLALQHHNTQSALDNVLLFQAYQRIIATGNFEPGEGLVMNEGTVSFLPADSNVTVVPPAMPTALENRKNQILADIFRLAFSQTRTSPDDGKAVQSAETQRESKEEFLATLQGAADDIQQLANESMANYMAWRSKADYDAEIKIDTDITIDDIDQQINAMSAYWNEISKYPTWKKESLKMIQVIQGLDDNEEIIKEIEAGEPAQENPQQSFRQSLEELANGETRSDQTQDREER